MEDKSLQNSPLSFISGVANPWATGHSWGMAYLQLGCASGRLACMHVQLN